MASNWSEEQLQEVLKRGTVRVVGERPTLTQAGKAVVVAHPLAVPEPQPPLSRTDEPHDRYRSKTERRYALLLQQRKAAGELREWWYEPCKGLYLAPRTSYTPDFLLWYTDPQRPLEFHEVKGGFIRAKDWQKTKWAAVAYPLFKFVLAQYKGQHWYWKEVPTV